MPLSLKSYVEDYQEFKVSAPRYLYIPPVLPRRGNEGEQAHAFPLRRACVYRVSITCFMVHFIFWKMILRALLRPYIFKRLFKAEAINNGFVLLCRVDGRQLKHSLCRVSVVSRYFMNVYISIFQAENCLLIFNQFLSSSLECYIISTLSGLNEFTLLTAQTLSFFQF